MIEKRWGGEVWYGGEGKRSISVGQVWIFFKSLIDHLSRQRRLYLYVNIYMSRWWPSKVSVKLVPDIFIDSLKNTYFWLKKFGYFKLIKFVIVPHQKWGGVQFNTIPLKFPESTPLKLALPMPAPLYNHPEPLCWKHTCFSGKLILQAPLEGQPLRPTNH